MTNGMIWFCLVVGALLLFELIGAWRSRGRRK